MATRCPGNMRHWFIIRGTVGLRSPVCVRCGDPNRRRGLTADEWAELAQFQEAGGRVGRFTKAALQKHQEEAAEERRRTADAELVRRNAVSDQQDQIPVGGQVPRLEGDNIIMNWHHKRP
jgi:hypothetical protein